MLPRLFTYSCAVSAFPAELSPSHGLPPGNPQILSHRVFNSWAVPAFPAGYSPSHAHRQGIRKSFPAAFSARVPCLLFPLSCHRVMAHRRGTPNRSAAFSTRVPCLLFPLSCHRVMAHRRGTPNRSAAFSTRVPCLLFPLNCHRVMAHRRGVKIPPTWEPGGRAKRPGYCSSRSDT